MFYKISPKQDFASVIAPEIIPNMVARMRVRYGTGTVSHDDDESGLTSWSLLYKFTEFI